MTAVPPVYTPALYGKIPAQGDFLRSNVVDPAAVEFSRWLEEAQEAMYRTGAALPALPVCFVHVVPQARTAVVGALLPSRDAVGRVFPFAAFVPVDAGQLSRSFPRAPLAFSMFLGEVARLGRDVATLAAPAVLERVRQLPLPGPAEWDLADELTERLLDQPAQGLLASLGEPASGAAYGLRTFLSACSGEAAEVPARTRVVLECPWPVKVRRCGWISREGCCAGAARPRSSGPRPRRPASSSPSALHRRRCSASWRDRIRGPTSSGRSGPRSRPPPTPRSPRSPPSSGRRWAIRTGPSDSFFPRFSRTDPS